MANNPTGTLGISITVAMGGLMFGFDVAIIGGAVPFIESYFHLDQLALGWAVSSLLLGAIPGAALAGGIADRISRQKALLWIAALFGISTVATGLAFSFTAFVAFRVLGGLAVGSVSVIAPMYLAETAPARMRGRLVSGYQLAITVGIVLSYLINFLLHDIGASNWRWMFISGALPSAVFWGCLLAVPESPRWLFMQNRIAEADSAFRRLLSAAEAGAALDRLTGGARSVYQRPIAWRQPTERNGLLLGMGLAVLVQFSGVNTVVDYAPKILQTAGWGLGNALFSTFGIGLCFVAFTVLGVAIIDRVGRRNLYLVGSAGMTLALCCLTALHYAGLFRGVWVLVLIVVYIAFFSTCIGTAFWTLVAEMFPNAVRARAMSLASLTNWAANFLVVFLFPWLLTTLGGTVTFGFLAVMAALQGVLAFICLDETNGKNLEEISFTGH